MLFAQPPWAKMESTTHPHISGMVLSTPGVFQTSVLLGWMPRPPSVCLLRILPSVLDPSWASWTCKTSSWSWNDGFKEAANTFFHDVKKHYIQRWIHANVHTDQTTMPIMVLAYMALSGHTHGPLSHVYAWRQVARDTKMKQKTNSSLLTWSRLCQLRQVQLQACLDA